MKRARVLRILEYEGPLEWVLQQIERRGIKGSYRVTERQAVIREAMLGDVPTLLHDEEVPNE